MSPTNHQTVRLSRGSHTSPNDGVCVMELASMLAGERFSDHPRSVCPVIATVLRAYNDAIDDERRRDLYPLAADAVGTRGSRAERRQRLKMCGDFFGVRVGRLPGPGGNLYTLALAVQHAATDASDSSHRSILELFQRLVGTSDRDDARPPAEEPLAVEPVGQA
ncbi:MAG TPA: hypothetical protein VF752_05470 [Thermoleophilaceae bacterium]